MPAHKIDIIIPCFNYADFLDECLSAILAQTRGDFAVLVMDNASEDHTPEVAARWMARDARIRYHRNDTNLGAVGNMQRGYELTSAELVVILPADDLWQPEFLELTCGALEAHPECSYAYTGWHANSGRKEDSARPMSWMPHAESGVVEDMPYLTIQNYIPLSFGVFRRAMCDQAGGAYPLFLPMLGDLYLWMRLAAVGPGFYVHQNLGRLRIHGGNESNALHATGRSAYDHIHLLDLVFQGEQWSLPLRLLAKARQIQLLTGRGLCETVASLGSPSTLGIMREYVGAVREELNALAADTVRTWLGRAVGMGDTLADAQALSPAEMPVMALDVERYHKWRSRRTPQEIDGQILAERMVRQWRFRPRFSIGLRIAAGEEERLADTLDALAAQWYPEWQLVVFAEGLQAPAELEGVAQVAWVSIEAGAPAGLAATLAVRDADFVAMLPAGSTLDAHALQVIADRLNLEAGWLALYTDDDVAQPGGQPADRLKPDFNLELLYSRDYIGPACFVCREALQAFAGQPEADQALPFGLLLRLFETTGATTIGHLPDPLLHLPGEPPTPSPDLLAGHLARRGVKATLAEGWFPATRRIRYQAIGKPLVSVVVLSQDQPGYLRTMLASLAQTAGYERLELVIGAHCCSDPDALAVIAAARAGEFGMATQVLELDGPFEPARFRNRAAALAGGDYLLFADDDLEFFQPDWLLQLLGAAQASGAAVLGPRLVDNSRDKPAIAGTALILGLAGMAGSMVPAGSDLMTRGYHLQPQLDQETSALTPHCLLVERAHFEALQGFDADCADTLHFALDFCLRTRAAGRRVLWLASVDVIHHGGPTLKRLLASRHVQSQWLARTEDERRNMLDRHLRALSHDPFYNRNLSLYEPFQADTEALIDWDTATHERLRVLGIPLTSGAGEYRMTSPFRALGKAGLAQCCIVHPLRHNVQRVLSPIEIARAEPDALMMQSAIDDAQLLALAEVRRHNPGVLRILALDDRLGEMLRDHPLYAYHALEGKSRLRRAAGLCDRLILSTEHLREYCADMCADIRVVPNRLERDSWCGLEVARNEGDKPRVGWVGAAQHLPDLKLIEAVVETLADEVDWVFMGMCPDFLRPHVKETHSFVSFRDYPAKMASLALDLAIAPLAIHPFNESKSNLRLLEYGAMGWPVICTDIYPYRTDNPPVTHLPNDPQRWIAAIRERVADREALAREGLRLQRWVHQHYILEDGLDEWLGALSPDASKKISTSTDLHRN